MRITVEPLTTALVTVADSIPTKTLYADIGAVVLPNVSLNESVTVFPFPTIDVNVGRAVSGPAEEKFETVVVASDTESFPPSS